MLNELSSAISLPNFRTVAANSDRPLPSRIAFPLIGCVSVGLWLLIGKAVMLLVA